MKYLLILAAMLFTPLGTAYAQDDQQRTEFIVTTLQAKPGKFRSFLDALQTTDWSAAEMTKPIIMRHSVGDSWDLMIMRPDEVPCELGTMSCRSALGRIQDMYSEHTRKDTRKEWTAFTHESWVEIEIKARAAGIYYVEMFKSLEGHYDNLVTQRLNENKYLEATGQNANSVFYSPDNPDVEVFTLGYFRDMKHFAESPDLTMDEQNRIARESGFVDRADLSFSLRAVISWHVDTLATRVD